VAGSIDHNQRLALEGLAQIDAVLGAQLGQLVLQHGRTFAGQRGRDGHGERE